MSDWTKYPGEVSLVTIDWTTFLAGNTIANTVTVNTSMTSLTANVTNTANNISTVTISGGIPGLIGSLVFSIPISGVGTPKQSVKTVRIKDYTEE